MRRMGWVLAGFWWAVTAGAIPDHQRGCDAVVANSGPSESDRRYELLAKMGIGTLQELFADFVHPYLSRRIYDVICPPEFDAECARRAQLIVFQKLFRDAGLPENSSFRAMPLPLLRRVYVTLGHRVLDADTLARSANEPWFVAQNSEELVGAPDKLRDAIPPRPDLVNGWVASALEAASLRPD